jgi:hypothetical protein
MKFEGKTVTGLNNALIGARLPMCKNYDEAENKAFGDEEAFTKTVALGEILCKADTVMGFGQPNGKFLRMIHLQVAVTAPLYWWKEFDTYKVGTVANSTSTMHKLADTPITKECFEMDDFTAHFESDAIFGTEIYMSDIWEAVIEHLEKMRISYNKNMEMAKEKNMTEQERKRMITIAKRYWRELIRLLPESWLQTRMIDIDYQTLRNIYFWRKNHKLTEWHTFCEFITTLPYAKEFLISEGE